MLLDCEAEALPKVLDGFMGRCCCQLTPPATKQHGLHVRWPNVGAKLPKYASGCCSVAQATR